MAEIQNRIGDNIRTVVSLEMGDKFKYMDVMRATHIDVIPESGIKGRGIAFVEGRLLEFQTALAIDAEDDYKRNAKIEAMSQKMRDMWDGNTAKQIPFIPENPVFDDLKNLDEYSVAVSNKRLIPFAYNYVDASVYSIDLADTYCCSISGKRRTGKTNLLKLLMYAVSQKNGKGVVIEKESNELKLLSSELGFEYIDSDKGVFDYFKSITDEFVARNKYKHILEEDGLSDLQIYEKMSVKEPMFIFISDITKFIDCVYHPEGNIMNMSGYFENIIEKGSLHNIYFFACINTDNLASAAGSNLYRLFTGYKTGVHLGGNVASQRIFNFQNIHYSQMSKSSKKGHALTPSKDDDTTALKIIVPLFGSREE
jgi:DNA segregation ATPase ftsK/spoIIIE and related proteins